MKAAFSAPWSALTKFITAAFLTLVIVLAIGSPIPGGLIALIMLVLGLLLWIREYRIENGKVIIQSILWKKSLDLSKLERVRYFPGGIGSSIRVMGSGGFFGFIGYFRSQEFGNYTAFVTDPNNSVFLELPDTRIVISPDDPIRFVTLVENEYTRISQKR